MKIISVYSLGTIRSYREESLRIRFVYVRDVFDHPICAHVNANLRLGDEFATADACI
jgi:hypothetical protein